MFLYLLFLFLLLTATKKKEGKQKKKKLVVSLTKKNPTPLPSLKFLVVFLFRSFLLFVLDPWHFGSGAKTSTSRALVLKQQKRKKEAHTPEETKMERAVVRMYFEDGSFKTFLLVPTTTAKELCEQVRTKLRTNCAYYLFATAPGQGKAFHYKQY